MNIFRTFKTGLLLMITLLASQAVAETINLGGVGCITPLAKRLASEYVRLNPGIEVRVVEPPLGSSGGLRALAGGKVDIVLSGRAPKTNEIGLTRMQIADIFAGRKTVWDDQKPIRLVMRSEFESETVALRKLSPEIDAAVAKALKRSDLPIPENDLEALETLQKIPGSLGTSSLGLIKASPTKLTILRIDGIAPSVKTLESGRYPLARQFLLVTSPTPRPAVRALLAWLQSPAALAITRTFDYLPFK